MTGALLEIARPRFLAADRASFLVIIGSQEHRVDRDRSIFIRAAGVVAPAVSAPPPWSDVIGLVFEFARAPGATTRHRILVGLENVVGLEVVD